MLIAWEVRKRVHDFEYHVIDVVFFDKSMDAYDVKKSLINHDGYDGDILVRRQRKSP